MKSFISDFKTKTCEINEYCYFVKYIDRIESHKQEKITDSSLKEYTPSRDLQKILRSTCFMLLYNLVESSIRNGILSVYDSIHDDLLKYEDLSEKIQEIWLSHQAKNGKKSEQNIKKWMKELVKKLSEGYQITLDKEIITISGNLDYNNIQKIINTYGFFGQSTVDKKDVEFSLNKVKQERNLLAHGNKTFCQSGEIVTISDITKIKEHIFIFLDELLTSIEKYIDNKKYKKITHQEAILS